MPEYIYTREIVENCYNIDNKDRVDGESNQIHLAKEVAVAFPEKTFKMICIATEVKFIFNESLDAGEQITLSNIVVAHKNNT